MGNRITLKEVAARAGVSYQTVSKVLNHQIQITRGTEERIWQAIQELDYRPNLIARSLRSQRSRMIGYSWVPTPPDQANPILDQFLQSMIQEAESASYHLLTFPYHSGADWTEAYRELLYTNRVDGFILSSIEYEDPRVLFLMDQGFPFVAFGRSSPKLDFPYVDVDGAAGMRMVIEHLVSLGHCRFGVLGWPESSRVGQNRMDGVLDALQIARVPGADIRILRGEGSYQFGYQASQGWLNLPVDDRPTAIVAFNDIMAIGAMNAVRSHGLRVGRDMAITGFDDAPMIQYLDPSLTSVRQPVWEVGKRVMGMLLNILDDNPPLEMHQLIVPRLIARASTRLEAGPDDGDRVQ